MGPGAISRTWLLVGLMLALGAAHFCGCVPRPTGAEGSSISSRPHRIGFLGASGAAPWHVALRDSLRTLGYVEGQDIVIETRYAGRRAGGLDDLAAELVNLPVDAIVTADFAATAAVLRQTSQVPIVMANSGSPLPSGLASAAARAGTNLTGIGASPSDLGAKRLEIAMAAFPGMHRVGILHDPDSLSRGADWEAMVTTVRDLGLELHDLPYRTPQDFEPAMAAARAQRVDVVLVMGDQIIGAGHESLVQIAADYGVKLLFERSDLVDMGALIAYGPSFRESYARSAVYVDRILKGASPGELPMEEPPAAQLGINLRVAQALGISIPLPVLLRADRVVD
jgi:putative tryptophan/tyrosine transport system substrate-binding protein